MFELFSFLSKALIASFKHKRKELVVTDGERVVCEPQQQDVYLLARHEDADSL